MTNIHVLMTALVSEPSHGDAYRLAMDFTEGELRDLADLVYADTIGRKETLAFRVVVEGRGLDEDESADLLRWVRQERRAAREARQLVSA